MCTGVTPGIENELVHRLAYTCGSVGAQVGRASAFFELLFGCEMATKKCDRSFPSAQQHDKQRGAVQERLCSFPQECTFISARQKGNIKHRAMDSPPCPHSHHTYTHSHTRGLQVELFNRLSSRCFVVHSNLELLPKVQELINCSTFRYPSTPQRKWTLL